MSSYTTAIILTSGSPPLSALWPIELLVSCFSIGVYEGGVTTLYIEDMLLTYWNSSESILDSNFSSETLG